MARRRRYDWYGYSPTKAIEVKGGIKARAKGKRGSFTDTWWGKRWIETLESFQIGARLSRGKAYAKKGQVMEVAIEPGVVSAQVQGSRSRPYRVEIGFETWSDAIWQKVAKLLDDQPLLAARLLNGDMPEELEEMLAKAKIRLFPAAYKDLSTHCSCPDWFNPCKHIAAVCYLLGIELDRDPFLLFTLRGREREEFLNGLRASRGEGEPVGSGEAANDLAELQEEALLKHLSGGDGADEETLPDFDRFWARPHLPAGLLADAVEPPVAAGVIRRLGTPPLWRSEEDFEALMAKVYPAFTVAGLARLAGNGGSEE